MKNTFTFPAMGTSVEGGFRIASKQAGQKLIADLQAAVASFEARFSRFRSESELSYLNGRPGTVTPVSNEMFRVLSAANAVWNKTDGLVDPTIGNAVIASGYDASFERLSTRAQQPSKQVGIRNATLLDVQLDAVRQTIRLPLGVQLDFGGIGKGYLLDALVPMIERATNHYWLSLGGDIVVSGYDDRGQPWYVYVQNPFEQDRDLGRLRPPQGRWDIATSGILKRGGVRNGESWHHLIDPRTGRPAKTDVVEVTALTTSGIDAEAIAKAVLLQGSKEGIRWAERQPHSEALAVLQDGNLVLTRGMDVLLTLY